MTTYQPKLIGDTGGYAVNTWIAIFGAVLTAGMAHADDVTWGASVQLWKSMSPKGELLDAGPAPTWLSPPPAATLGRILDLPRSAPMGTPRPQPLPETLITEKGPSLPPPVAEKKMERGQFAVTHVPGPAATPISPAARLILPKP
jgi:hypothetical protein